MLADFHSLAEGVFDLFFPRICAACCHGIPVKGGIFCIECLADLPETGFHLQKDNPFERHFWGRIRIEAGAAFLFFVPGGKTQELLHNIKYRGQSDYALEIGRFYGSKVIDTGRFDHIDIIIPVPLHWKKQRKRGFNQSSAFGRGLAHEMGVAIDTKVLIRSRMTPTQTRKGRSERVVNMHDAFRVTRPDKIRNKHVLIVDDVLTTGATLEACAIALLSAAPVHISMLTIACGRI